MASGKPTALISEPERSDTDSFRFVCRVTFTFGPWEISLSPILPGRQGFLMVLGKVTERIRL